MVVHFIEFSLSEVKSSLWPAYNETSERGLHHSAKFIAELLHCMRDVTAKATPPGASRTDDVEMYALCKTYFDLNEYDRAAYFSENATSHRCRFIHFYSSYLSGEKKKNSDITDPFSAVDSSANEHLNVLRSDLSSLHSDGELDGYLLYLYGITLKQLGLKEKAMQILTESIHLVPTHWGSWHELAMLINDRTTLDQLDLPQHWMYNFFVGHTQLELLMNEEALTLYSKLQELGLQESTYMTSQIAIAYHNMRDVDAAVSTFEELHKVDPYRLDSLDIYSNLLYVKGMCVDLSYLAHHAASVDKYRVETCTVIGNYYSLRSQHEKAVVYFQRALRLKPQYLAAWTLMGHEYMEMKNTNAAIQSYRQAIEVNQRDYRAWYGLGQTYEILKMYYYCLYYYKQAQLLRPNDSRMLVALGDSYEKLERLQEAKKCFWRAHSVGDLEGIAMHSLAKLYEKLKEYDEAAKANCDYIRETDASGGGEQEKVIHSIRYLANYYSGCAALDEATMYAQRCTEYPELREEGKAILRQVALLRQEENNKTHDQSGDDMFASPL